MLNSKELANLVQLADALDRQGMHKEASQLDSTLQSIIKKADDEKGMSKKLKSALSTLKRSSESFCSKNLDTRGPHRKALNKICDMCEELGQLCGEFITEDIPEMEEEEKEKEEKGEE